MVCLGALTGAITLGAYDLHTPELVPVKMKTPDSHRPVKLIENGKLNFAIVSDTKTEQRMAKKNRTKKSIVPAVAAIAGAAVLALAGAAAAIIISKRRSGK